MRPLRAFSLTMILASTATIVIGAEPPALTTSPQVKNEKGEPKVGLVRSARSLIGVVVQDRDGNAFGRVEDVALDIGKGKVQSVFVMPGAMPGGTRPRESLTISIMQLDVPERDGPIILGAPVDKSATRPLPGSPNDESQVVLFSALQTQPIHNGQGDKLGIVADVAVAPKSNMIAYVAVALDGQPSEKLFPIPLTAFVVPERPGTWILELPAEIVSHTPSFTHDKWPTAISRAWTEYVHVRYGRSPFGGVERRLLEAKRR